MRTSLALGFGLILALVATPALAATNSELKVGQDGVFSAKNILLYQKSGSALYSRAVWGNSFVRMTVIVAASGTGTTTQLIKAHGGTATLDDFKAGDLLNIEGSLQLGADSLLVNATKITDLSANQEAKNVSGTIKSISGTSAVITDKKLGTITLELGSATITKGVRSISAGELKVGDKVTYAAGTYDYASNTFSASGSVVVYQDQSVFKPRNFQGTIKSISGTTLPTSMVVSTNDADYQVFLASSTKIYSKTYTPISLSRLAVGDSVRLYGAIRQDNLANVDATILRDLNF